MASIKKGKFGSDDEDDLESLRLAALNSLKPKANPVVALKPLDVNHGRPQNIYKQHSTFGAAQTTRNHNRGFRNNGGRIGRNGINPRIRGNPNLISIQVIDENESKEPVIETVRAEAPKLILPQDRYHKTQNADVTKEKESLSNKFDRYKNSSDESDSDSDERNSIPTKRERKNSLEALIDDIDNILEGKTMDEKKSESDDENIDHKEKETNDTLIIEDIDPDIVQIIENEEKSTPPPKEERQLNRSRSRSRSRSPYIKKSRSRSKSPYSKIKSPYRSPPPRRSPIRKRYSPLPYSRAPLPALTLNTDVLNTITMAPLSPRSAAFVLENRQILARRQMSPRRSRSPARRSTSPKTRRRSRSRSPISRKCSLSPRKRSNSPKFSPKRRSTSPRNYARRSYKNRNSNSPVVKQSVHKRLGTKSSPQTATTTTTQPLKRKRTSRSISLSLSPSPDRSYHKRPLNETTGQLNDNKVKRKEPEDPVLLARKKKFECPVPLGKNNGVIKLNANKPKQNEISESESDKECFNEASDIEIELNTNIDDLWSDEESDNENEGRFKSKTSNQKNIVPTISIRNLTEKAAVPKEPLLARCYSDRDKSTSRTYNDRDKSTRRSKYDSGRRKKNPSRDEKSSKERSKSKVRDTDKNKETHDEIEHKDMKTSSEDKQPTNRRVKLNSESDVVVLDCSTQVTDEPEVIIGNDEDASKDEESDLRAEISRRRAERLQKAGSLAGALPTRLLKSALQEVVPKRPTTKTSNLSKGSTAADRKVLIIKSIASSPVTKIEPANKVITKKEVGKLPIHMRLGQTKTNVIDACADELDNSGGDGGAGVRERDRRPKKSRSSKRKNRKVVQV